MIAQRHFIEPLDVLFLRGNKLFGEAGSYGESLVPPWPSVAAGALRTALLAYKGADINAFAGGRLEDPELGTPEKPGPFALTLFNLALKTKGPNTAVEPLYPMPADLVVRKSGEEQAGKKHDGGKLCLERLRPHSSHSGIRSSRSTRLLAVLPEKSRGKPELGFWLRAEGWRKYLEGETPAQNDLVKSGDLWQLETRVGVGLDAASRRARDGALFSAQAVSLNKPENKPEQGPESGAVGFLAETEGAAFPEKFALRLGGDGRAAIASRVDAVLPKSNLEVIANSGCCRLVLTSPGIFTSGWMPNGISSDETFSLYGVRGTLVCAAVPRAEIVSGFDLAKRRPKVARRVAPTGSVYWLENLDATPEALENLVTQGLWPIEVEDPSRRAEGFNRLAIAAY